MSGDAHVSIVGSVDLLPALSVIPPGVLVVRRHWDADDTWLTIIRADPHVEFSNELLSEFSAGGDNDGMYPDVELDETPEHRLWCACPDKAICFTDCVIRIKGRDQTVVYRIAEYVPSRNTWRASWPD